MAASRVTTGFPRTSRNDIDALTQLRQTRERGVRDRRSACHGSAPVVCRQVLHHAVQAADAWTIYARRRSVYSVSSYHWKYRCGSSPTARMCSAGMSTETKEARCRHRPPGGRCARGPFHKALARGMFIRATEPSRHTTIEHVNAAADLHAWRLCVLQRYSRALGVATASSSMSQTDSARPPVLPSCLPRSRGARRSCVATCGCEREWTPEPWFKNSAVPSRWTHCRPR